LLLAVSLSGWWYLRTFAETGTLTGELNDRAASAAAGISLPAAVFEVAWLRVFDLLATTFIWLGNWSFLVARSWMYKVIEFFWALSLAGISIQALRPRQSLPQRRDLVLLAVPCLALLGGLCYQSARLYQATGRAGTLGHYLDAFSVAGVILLMAGLSRLAPERWQFSPAPLLTLLLLTVETFGTWFLALPYYAGLIRHNQWGGLGAHPVLSYVNDGILPLLERTLSNKPAFLGTGHLILLAVLFLGSGLALLAISARLAFPAGERRSR